MEGRLIDVGFQISIKFKTYRIGNRKAKAVFTAAERFAKRD